MKNWPLLWHRSTSMGLCFFLKNQWHFRFFFPTNNQEIKPNTDTANTFCFLPFTVYSDKRFSHSSLWLICLYVLHFPRPQLLLAVACLTVWFCQTGWLCFSLTPTLIWLIVKRMFYCERLIWIQFEVWIWKQTMMENFHVVSVLSASTRVQARVVVNMCVCSCAVKTFV